MNSKGIIAPKSYHFALRIIQLYKWLCSEKKEFVLAKQVLRSGTAIGALIKEAEHAQSKPDFLNKMNIALKEANETEYWLMLLKDSDFLSVIEFNSMHTDCSELIKLLASTVKTTKTSLQK
ncbi:MAG: four helix bundle protein [Prevotellaceae bacterium]|jgi:four helix bundle protein|nr:four helix bundle protein [Prevotellaceae bacterium]